MNGITICTICMDPIGQNNYCKLKCNHYFCLPCIFSQYTYKNQCPVCRNQILKNKIKFVEKHFHNNQLPPTAPPSPPLPPPFPTISKVDNSIVPSPNAVSKRLAPNQMSPGPG